MVSQIVVTPRTELSEFPLQNFYRYVLSPHYATSTAGDADAESTAAAANAGSAVFRALPRQHTLTVRIDSPEPWNIQATSAVQVSG